MRRSAYPSINLSLRQRDDYERLYKKNMQPLTFQQPSVPRGAPRPYSFPRRDSAISLESGQIPVDDYGTAFARPPAETPDFNQLEEGQVTPSAAGETLERGFSASLAGLDPRPTPAADPSQSVNNSLVRDVVLQKFEGLERKQLQTDEALAKLIAQRLSHRDDTMLAQKELVNQLVHSKCTALFEQFTESMLKFTGSVDGRLRSAEADGEKERM